MVFSERRDAVHNDILKVALGTAAATMVLLTGAALWQRARGGSSSSSTPRQSLVRSVGGGGGARTVRFANTSPVIIGRGAGGGGIGARSSSTVRREPLDLARSTRQLAQSANDRRELFRRAQQQQQSATSTRSALQQSEPSGRAQPRSAAQPRRAEPRRAEPMTSGTTLFAQLAQERRRGQRLRGNGAFSRLDISKVAQ